MGRATPKPWNDGLLLWAVVVYTAAAGCAFNHPAHETDPPFGSDQNAKTAHALTVRIEEGRGTADDRAQLATILIREQRYDAAESTLESAIRSDPGEPRFYQLLALKRRRCPRGSAQDAIAILEAGHRAAPQDVALSADLTVTYAEAGRDADARRQAGEVLSRAPRSSSAALAHLVLAESDSKSGDSAAAERHRAAAEQLNPDVFDLSTAETSLPIDVRPGSETSEFPPDHPETTERIRRLDSLLREDDPAER